VEDGHGRATPTWLAVREPADAAARSRELVDALVDALAGTDPDADLAAAGRRRERRAPGRRLVVHDLGCGTGSMSRWLAPLLPGPQHWVLLDRDADLLAVAATRVPERAAGGAAVTLESHQRDITRLGPDGLSGSDLVTASALLDMLTGAELDRFVRSCAAARCPVLVTLSVVGRVSLEPADPFDRQVEAAFNAHQRRTVGGHRLLGPDGARAAVDAFGRLGFDVLRRPSPWLLEAQDRELVREWFTGWLGAALEQDPSLVARAGTYAERRLAEASAGRLAVTVQHEDVLALPR
jgi:SAM-dependent methyltransferase